MSNICFRKGALVHLRPLERKDIPLLRTWMNDPEVTQYLMRTLPLMEAEEERWLDSLAGSKTDFALGIVSNEDSKLFGTVGMHGINWIHRTGECGIQLGEATYRTHGHGTEAIMLMTDFALNALDLHSVMAKVYTVNAASIACCKKCGYKEAGRLPKWVHLPTGERCDEALLVATQETWRPLYEKYRNNREEFIAPSTKKR